VTKETKMFNKFVPAATGATHVEATATIVDVINPLVPLSDSTSNLARAAVYAVGGWVGRGYRDNKTFGF